MNRSGAGAVASRQQTNEVGERADVLVVFGVTGDLAKAMTFRGLYRLEQHGLLYGVRPVQLDGPTAADALVCGCPDWHDPSKAECT
jgi:hypothetical protein